MQNKNKSGFDFGFFLHNFWLSVKRLFWVPILLAMITGAFEYMTIRRSYIAMYESTAVFAVSANYASSTDIMTYSYYYDSNAASTLASTFKYVLMTDSAKQLIYQHMNTSSLPATVSATCVAGSNLFVMSASSGTPEMAYYVLETVIDIYPQAAANILGSITIQLLDPPKMADAPINPYDPVTPALTYALFGFLAGIAILAAAALLRKVVHTSNDLHALVNIPCLSFLPNVRFKARSNVKDQSIIITNPRVDPSYLESVRTMRFKLCKELEKFPGKVIMVTSTVPNEGKTTVSANLALSLAEQGKRVILVDADLRKQSVKSAFGIKEPSEGLAELIASKQSEIKPLAVPNSSLLLLSGDKIADEPLTFLSSARMHKILASLRAQMDYVIIDTPPCGFLSDAVVLSECVDCTLYIVRQDYSSRAQILNCIQGLSSADVHFIGCVLNNTEFGTTKYGYGSRYGYGSKYSSHYGLYGYGYGKGEPDVTSPDDDDGEYVK